jgi:hypothetical protein
MLPQILRQSQENCSGRRPRCRHADRQSVAGSCDTMGYLINSLKTKDCSQGAQDMACLASSTFCSIIRRMLNSLTPNRSTACCDSTRRRRSLHPRFGRPSAESLQGAWAETSLGDSCNDTCQPMLPQVTPVGEPQDCWPRPIGKVLDNRGRSSLSSTRSCRLEALTVNWISCSPALPRPAAGRGVRQAADGWQPHSGCPRLPRMLVAAVWPSGYERFSSLLTPPCAT